MIKLLIDECLHTPLAAVAHEAGFVCDHVNFLGFGGHKDWHLMSKIRAGEYTFVTNNRSDFARLYGKEEVHAGLIVIVPSVVPSRQRELFLAALIHISERDLTNTVLEADVAGDAIVCRDYRYP